MWSAFRAEMLKYRRSWAFYFTVGLPLFVTFVTSLNFGLRKEYWLGIGRFTWLWFAHSNRSMWGVLLLSLYVASIAALIAYLEHSSGNWKLILAQPVRRSAVYLAKLLMGVLLLTLSTLVLAAATLLAGLAFGFSGEISVGRFLLGVLVGIPAVWPALALHFWLGVRFRNFLVTLGVALAGEFLGLLSFTHKIGRYFPWSFPIATLGANRQQGIDWNYLGVVVLLGLVIGLAGAWDFHRKEVT